MDRFETMSVFLAVVEGGSLSAAGRRLGMPLATVSRKLAQLESHLDARLLSRSTRQLDLTEAGRAYLDACKRILGDVADAERAAAGEYSAPQGELAITAPIVFGRLHVLPIVTEFLQATPAVDVRLVLSDRNAHLLDEHVDLAVRIGVLPDSRLTARPLGALRRMVCASPAYWKSHGRPKTPADLAAHRCVTFDIGGAPDAWTFRADKTGARTTTVVVRSRLAVNTAEAAVDAAVAGLGPTRLLSYQAEAARRAGQLIVALADFEPARSPVNLVFDAQQRVTLKLRAFLEFAAPRLKKRIAAIG